MDMSTLFAGKNKRILGDMPKSKSKAPEKKKDFPDRSTRVAKLKSIKEK